MDNGVEGTSPYEPPALIEVGSVNAVTRGDFFESGQDSWSWINKIGIHLVGS